MKVMHTVGIWLGNERNSPVKYMPHLQMIDLQIVGIWFTNALKDCEEINLRGTFSEIKALYKVWMKTTNNSPWQGYHPEDTLFVKKYLFVDYVA